MLMRHVAAFVLASLALAIAACNQDDPNPFEGINLMTPPPASAVLIFTSNLYSTTAGSARELYAANADGSGLTRLTTCANGPGCDIVEAAPSPDRTRVVARRAARRAGDEALALLDLSRSIEGTLVRAESKVSGIDWSPDGSLILFSSVATTATGVEDVFVIEPNGANQRAVTTSPSRERRPRINPASSAALYERFDTAGKSRILRTDRVDIVTQGGPGTEALTGTPYIVGSDADPDYSPDGQSLVFRRLTATGVGGLGAWDLMLARTDGTDLRVLATGARFRGTPDWGPRGIAYIETDPAAGTTALVVIQPDGSSRRALVTMASRIDMAFPRWLP